MKTNYEAAMRLIGLLCASDHSVPNSQVIVAHEFLEKREQEYKKTLKELMETCMLANKGMEIATRELEHYKGIVDRKEFRDQLEQQAKQEAEIRAAKVYAWDLREMLISILNQNRSVLPVDVVRAGDDLCDKGSAHATQH